MLANWNLRQMKRPSQLAEDFLTILERQAADYLPGAKCVDMEPEMIV